MEYRHSTFTNTTTCMGCGVLVGDRELHDKFHESLARVASKADSADMWTRPIGSGRGPYPQVDPANVVNLGDEID